MLGIPLQRRKRFHMLTESSERLRRSRARWRVCDLADLHEDPTSADRALATRSDPTDPAATGWGEDGYGESMYGDRGQRVVTLEGAAKRDLLQHLTEPQPSAAARRGSPRRCPGQGRSAEEPAKR